jgi:uncharacterized protein YbjT (DUF2867 family)
VYDGGESADVVGAWHRQAEGAVTGSGLDWTILRPGRFMSNALGWGPMIQRGDTVYVPWAHRPTASIDPADIAAVAAAVLTGRDGGKLAGRAVRLTGPELMSPAAEVALLGELLGRDVRVVEPSIKDTTSGMLRYMAPDIVEAIVARTLTEDDPTVVEPAVPDVLGRPARTFRAWAQAHLAAFSG